MFFQIKFKIIFYVLIPVIIISIVSGYFTNKTTVANEIENTDRFMTVYTAQIAENINNELKDIEIITQNGADYVAMSDFVSEEEAYRFLERNPAKSKLLLGSRFAFDPSFTKGKLRLQSVTKIDGKLNRADLSDRILYTDPEELWYHIPFVEGRAYWDKPFVDRESGKLCSRFSCPIVKSGKRIGVASARIDLTTLNTILDTTYYKTLNFIIIDRDGTFIFHPSKKRIQRDNILRLSGTSVNADDQRSEGMKMLNGLSGKAILRFDDKPGKQLYAYYQPIRRTGWSLSASVSEDELLAHVYKGTRNSVVIGAVTICAILLILLILADKITKPIVLLTNTVLHFSDKNKRDEVTITSNDEIGKLAASFNTMTREILTREQELKDLTHRFKFAFQATNDGIFDWFIKSGELYFSDRFFELFGYSPNEFNPSVEKWLSMNHSSTVEQSSKAVYDALVNNSSYETEFLGVKKNGETFWVLARGVVVETDVNGNASRVVGTNSDISSRKKAELQIQELNKSLEEKVEERTKSLEQTLLRMSSINAKLASQNLALNSSAIVSLSDIDGNITEVNDQFCIVSKYTKEEVIGQNHRILNSGFHSKEFFADMWKTIGSGNVWRGQVRNKAKDGTFYWVDSVIAPVLDAQGKPAEYLSIRFDITQQKNVEVAVKAAEEMSRNILESVSNGIFGTDKDGYITFVNHAVESMLGFSAEELIGQKSHPVFHYHYADGTEYPAVDCPMYHALSEGKTSIIDNEVLWRKDGSSFPVEYSATPIIQATE
ncbi:MAG: PAS domain S-box protein, partial [Ignavibacteriales bacterium]|nr:PAS domain S-box protein [Ignavibacteriales bacterium]